jgi:hypothetical protein
MIKINATNEVGIIPDRMPGNSLTTAVFHALFFSLNGHGSEPSAGLGINTSRGNTAHLWFLLVDSGSAEYSPFSHLRRRVPWTVLDIGYQ